MSSDKICKSGFRLPNRLKIEMELNLVNRLKIVVITVLNINEFLFLEFILISYHFKALANLIKAESKGGIFVTHENSHILVPMKIFFLLGNVFVHNHC